MLTQVPGFGSVKLPDVWSTSAEAGAGGRSIPDGKVVERTTSSGAAVSFSPATRVVSFSSSNSAVSGSVATVVQAPRPTYAAPTAASNRKIGTGVSAAATQQRLLASAVAPSALGRSVSSPSSGRGQTHIQPHSGSSGGSGSGIGSGGGRGRVTVMDDADDDIAALDAEVLARTPKTAAAALAPLKVSDTVTSTTSDELLDASIHAHAEEQQSNSSSSLRGPAALYHVDREHSEPYAGAARSSSSSLRPAQERKQTGKSNRKTSAAALAAAAPVSRSPLDSVDEPATPSTPADALRQTADTNYTTYDDLDAAPHLSSLGVRNVGYGGAGDGHSAALDGGAVMGPCDRCCRRCRTCTNRPGGCCRTLVTGLGGLIEAYDLFAMNVVLVVLQLIYPDSDRDSMKSALATAVAVGSTVGQLLFGLVADAYGRRTTFIATLLIVTVGAILSACSFAAGSLQVITALIIFRVFLGIGLGGEYPLSATVSMENRGRRRDMACVWSMQSIGLILAPCVILILLVALPINSDSDLSLLWRLALGFAAIPGILFCYWRYHMTETAPWQHSRDQLQEQERHQQRIKAQDVRNRTFPGYHVDDIIGGVGEDGAAAGTEEAANAAGTNGSNADSILSLEYTSRWAMVRQNWRPLLATAGTWFIFDAVFYANVMFSATILERVDRLQGDITDYSSVRDLLLRVTRETLILAALALPGYWTGVWLIDRTSRRTLQILGFLLMGVTYTVTGLLWAYGGLSAPDAHPGFFYLLYGLTFFVATAGPNLTTYTIPAEIFPTQVRATMHGISAAAGRVGAIVGSACIPYLLDDSNSTGGLDTVFYVSGGASVTGALVSWIVLEERLMATRTLEGLDLDYTSSSTSSTATKHASTVASNSVIDDPSEALARSAFSKYDAFNRNGGGGGGSAGLFGLDE